MYVRLAFAVAAHLESEILAADEVLAVEHARFQRKCLGRMKEVSTGEGRTVLFVSHNMAAIHNRCTRCVLLESGQAIAEGITAETTAKYIAMIEGSDHDPIDGATGSGRKRDDASDAHRSAKC